MKRDNNKFGKIIFGFMVLGFLVLYLAISSNMVCDSRWIKNTDYTLIATGTANITFWDSPTGGTLLWDGTATITNSWYSQCWYNLPETLYYNRTVYVDLSVTVGASTEDLDYSGDERQKYQINFGRLVRMDASTASDVVVKLADAAGNYALSLVDSADTEVSFLTSDGDLHVTGNVSFPDSQDTRIDFGMGSSSSKWAGLCSGWEQCFSNDNGFVFHKSTAQAWGAEKVHFDFANDYYTFDGDVGIGITSPDENLHLEGENATLLIRASSGTTDYSGIWLDAGSGDTNRWHIDANHAGVGSKLQIGKGTGNVITGLSSGTHLTIDTNGKVGIGTTSIVSPLMSVNIVTEFLNSLDDTGVFINSGAANKVSSLFLGKNDAAQWQFQSRNEIDTPHNRLSIFDNSTNEVVSILQNGNVGIGTTAPSVLLTVNGAACDSDGTLDTCASDQALKENINYNINALNMLDKLKPAFYNYVDDPANTKYAGFIAQDLEADFPNYVWTKSDGYKTYRDPGLKFLNTRAIQQLLDRVETIENETCVRDNTYSWC